MPPGRSIPRSPSSRPRRPKLEAEPADLPIDLTKASGEITSLATRIRGCTNCERACPERAIGTGYPRAPVMLLKERPSSEDAEAGGAFVNEAEALTKAFEALGIPISWTFGATAVRCGDAPATRDQMHACATHVLIEVEAIQPRVLVVFGEKTLEVIRALDGRCGLRIPEEIPRGEAVGVRTDLALIVTEALPEGIENKEAKRRMWRDLQLVPKLLGRA